MLNVSKSISTSKRNDLKFMAIFDCTKIVINNCMLNCNMLKPFRHAEVRLATGEQVAWCFFLHRFFAVCWNFQSGVGSSSFHTGTSFVNF